MVIINPEGKESSLYDNNITDNINLNEFQEKFTINCSVVIKSDLSTGSTSLDLYKTSENDVRYTLFIENENPVFVYDEQGNSPTHQQNAIKNITITPLSYYIYDNENEEKISGEDLPADFARWTFPDSQSTLIIQANGTEFYAQTVSFQIADKYNPQKTNRNTIILEVKYDGESLVASTEINFIKQGENGTNGTDFAAKIIPNPAFFEHTYFPIVPISPLLGRFQSSGEWFNAQLFYNGNLIFEGHETGTLNRNTTGLDPTGQVKVQWKFLKNNNKETQFFEVNEAGLFNVASDAGVYVIEDNDSGEDETCVVNILQVTLTYTVGLTEDGETGEKTSTGGNKSVIVTMPIASISGPNSETVYIEEGNAVKISYRNEKVIFN